MAASIARLPTLGAERWPEEAEPDDIPAQNSATDADVAVLYCEEAPRLRRMLGRRLAPERAADLVQMVFVRMLGIGASRRTALDQPQAYLTRVAGNLLRDEAKFAVRRSEALHVDADKGVGMSLLTGNERQTAIRANSAVVS